MVACRGEEKQPKGVEGPSWICQEMDSGDRVFFLQENVWRTPVLDKMKEHGLGGQSQGGHLQQADRHGSKGNVELNRRIQCKSWGAGLNCATGYSKDHKFVWSNTVFLFT